MTRASFRLFRTCLIGSVIVALAAGGHLAGGGQLPHPVILTALCAVAMIPTAFLTRFRLSFPVLAGLLCAGQAWLHWSFGALQSRGPCAVPEPARAWPSRPCGRRTGAGAVRRRHARYRRRAWTPPCSPRTRWRPSVLPCCWPAGSGPWPPWPRGSGRWSALRSLSRSLPAPATRPCMASRIIPLGRAGRRLPARRGPPACASCRLRPSRRSRCGRGGGRRPASRPDNAPAVSRPVCERHPAMKTSLAPYPPDRRSRHNDRRPARRRRRSRLGPRPRRSGRHRRRRLHPPDLQRAQRNPRRPRPASSKSPCQRTPR